MPIPSIWLGIFLAQARDPLEAYHYYLKKETKGWDKHEEGFKRTRHIALDWTRTAATGISPDTTTTKDDKDKETGDQTEEDAVDDHVLEASRLETGGIELVLLHRS